MANASPSTQTSDPSNGQLIFATLRDLFAELYSAENDARVVVDDAGLDAKQIALRARPNQLASYPERLDSQGV